MQILIQQQKKLLLPLLVLLIFEVTSTVQAFVAHCPAAAQQSAAPTSLSRRRSRDKLLAQPRKDCNRHHHCAPAASSKGRKATGKSHHTPHDPAVAINQKLVELGKQRKWEEVLDLTMQEQPNLNNVNFSAAVSQLGHIQSFDKSDPQFLSFLRVLARMTEQQGLPWIKAREAANVVHAIGKMGLKNPGTK